MQHLLLLLAPVLQQLQAAAAGGCVQRAVVAGQGERLWRGERGEGQGWQANPVFTIQEQEAAP